MKTKTLTHAQKMMNEYIKNKLLFDTNMYWEEMYHEWGA